MMRARRAAGAPRRRRSGAAALRDQDLCSGPGELHAGARDRDVGQRQLALDGPREDLRARALGGAREGVLMTGASASRARWRAALALLRRGQQPRLAAPAARRPGLGGRARAARSEDRRAAPLGAEPCGVAELVGEEDGAAAPAPTVPVAPPGAAAPVFCSAPGEPLEVLEVPGAPAAGELAGFEVAVEGDPVSAGVCAAAPPAARAAALSALSFSIPSAASMKSCQISAGKVRRARGRRRSRSSSGQLVGVADPDGDGVLGVPADEPRVAVIGGRAGLAGRELADRGGRAGADGEHRLEDRGLGLPRRRPGGPAGIRGCGRLGGPVGRGCSMPTGAWMPAGPRRCRRASR